MRGLDEIECLVKAVELKPLTAAAKALKGNEVAITLKQRAKRRLVALPGIVCQGLSFSTVFTAN